MDIQNIIFTGKIYGELEELFRKEQYLKHKNLRFLPEGEVTEKDMAWGDVFVSFRPNENFSFGNIKWVHSLGAGVDSFLKLENWPEDVLLTRTVTSFGQKIGEYCLSYMLKNLQFHQEFTRQKEKKNWKVIQPVSLGETKVLIYGTGAVGQEAARLLSCLGVQVFGVSKSGTDKEYFQKVFALSRMGQEVTGKMDYIINTLPLTKDTDKLFSQTFFESLNQAVFINVGRGASVDNKALLAAIERGNVKSAVLDVFEHEPLPQASPLWEHPDITITPHISAITSPEEAAECFLETLKRLEADQMLSNKVEINKGY